MAVEIQTFDPMENWAQSYGPEACKILVAHCELVYKKEVVFVNITMTVFKYRLSDRGETLLALTNQNFLTALRRREAEDAWHLREEIDKL